MCLQDELFFDVFNTDSNGEDASFFSVKFAVAARATAEGGKASGWITTLHGARPDNLSGHPKAS